MPDLTPIQWMLAVLAAASMGISKGGLAGLSLIHVAIFAFLLTMGRVLTLRGRAHNGGTLGGSPRSLTFH